MKDKKNGTSFFFGILVAHALYTCKHWHRKVNKLKHWMLNTFFHVDKSMLTQIKL